MSMSAPVIHRNIRVSGRVQGVFYRATAMDKALQLGVKGFVRNEPDGSVYIEAEGTEKNVESLIEWCRTGPAFSKVTSVTVEEGMVYGYNGFKIER